MPRLEHDNKLIQRLESFLRQYYKPHLNHLAQHYPNDQRSLTIDWKDIYRYDHEIADDIIDNPDQILDYFGEAIREFDLPIDVELNDVHVRVENLTRRLGVSETRSRHVNQYLAVTGQVAKVSAVNPCLQEAAFVCQRCGTVTPMSQSDGYREPHECQGCERQGPFELDFNKSEFVDQQVVRVQEPPERTKGGEGEHLDVYLEEDLVGAMDAGDRVTVNGILRIEHPDSKQKTPSMGTYFDGYSVEIEQSDFEDIDVDPYITDIKEIANGERGDPYRKLVDSIAPRVHGMDDIKEAVALQLFGGWRHEHEDGTADRGDSHIFLVGDPGSGKSTILRAVEELAPRAVFSEGKGLTKAGATAAAVRDDFGDTEWGLEAGALVLANKGIACIDELDKVDDEAKESLHGALESQRVPINKAGINTKLPAQTALLAAGNPAYGRFDPREPIPQQIELSPTLVSRFDLIFTVTDKPDKDRDERIASHIVETRRVVGKTQRGEELSENEQELIEPAIERELLRAYIAYAKQNIMPVIRDEDVRDELVRFYRELRSMGGEDGPVPVTARSLDAIQRLAEASARVRLSETIMREDVQRATRLVQKTMREIGLDPDTGQFDVDIIETGTSQSQEQRLRLVQGLISELEGEEPAEIEEVVRRAESEGVDRDRARSDVEKLLDEGSIYQPKQGYVRTV